ncbi:MAG: hypothetical protein Q8R13_02355 [bacterium]|nr:hypothetical protein [bacterium]MDZ4296523.1 hypothetical protein [Patescibacteria group bacterium]
MLFRLALILAVLAIVGGLAGAAAAEGDVSVTVTLKGVSSHVVDAGLELSDKPALQTDVFVTFPGGFYFDFWHSAGLGNLSLSSDFADEIDYTLGWIGKIRNFTVDMGVAYFDLIELLDMPRGDIWRLHFDICRQIDLANEHWVRPFARIEGLYPAGGDTPESGMNLRIGLLHWLRLGSHVGIAQKLSLIYDDGMGGLQPAVLGKYEVGPQWSLPRKLTLEAPYVKVNGPFTGVTDGRNWHVVVGAALSFKF